jgi:zinc protease
MPTKKPVSKKVQPSPVPGFSHIVSAGGVHEYVLKSNGLRVLYHHRPHTGVVTTNITYLVGARDETRGETGVAHMLEHMLFKPTVSDVAAGIDSASMQFERETGCHLNANTWKDRTTYHFSYPAEYLDRALQIEAERMNGVILTDESLAPERSNVLSEFDMRNGDPDFALDAAMVGTAYHSHPYGHETIGYREDIERYNAASLERFYRLYYRPDNAVMMVVGDVDEKTALTKIKKHFSAIEKPTVPIPRFHITEPKQEGLRRVIVKRPSELNIVALGFKHNGFPSEDWFVASALLEVLTSGPESVLHKALVDNGIATSADGSLGPTSEENIGTLSITLAPDSTHEGVEEMVRVIIDRLDTKTVTPLLKKVKARLLTDELFARDSSLRITDELTEYVASGNWTAYAKTPEILDRITVKMVLEAAQTLFDDTTMTIGYFIGTRSSK